MIKGWSWLQGGGASATFKTIQVPNGTSPVATGPTDILTLTSSDNSITITGDATTDTVDLVLAGGAVAPGGADTNVQFNDGGVFGGDSSLIWDKTTNRLGVTQATPLAPVHAGATSYTIGNASSLTITSYTQSTSGGLPFGQAQVYEVYGKRTVTKSDSSTETIYSATAATVTSDSSYSITPIGSSGEADYGGYGYTADGVSMDFNIYPLYNSDTEIGTPFYSAVGNDGSFNPFSINHTIVPPTWGTPSNYLVVRVNDDNWQIVSGSFADFNDMWTADPTGTAQVATYAQITGLDIALSWSAAASADDYRILNTTTDKWVDQGGVSTTITDQNAWTAGTPTVTPNSAIDLSLIADGVAKFSSVLNHTGTNVGFFGGTPVVQPSGNIITALGSSGVNLIDSPTMPGSGITGTAYHVAAFDGSGLGTSSSNVVSRNNGLGIGFNTVSANTSTLTANTLDVATQQRLRMRTINTSTGTKNDVSTANLSHGYSNQAGVATFTGFADGVDGKILIITNGQSGTIEFVNNSSSSSVGNRIMIGSGTPAGTTLTSTVPKAFMFIYDATNGFWKLVGGDKEVILASSNVFTNNNAFQKAVTIDQNFRHNFAEKTTDYTLVNLTDANIDYNSSSNRVLTLHAATNTSALTHVKNSGTGTVTINTTGGGLIDGYASGQIVLNQHDSILLTTKGAAGPKWKILGFWKRPGAGQIVFGDANGVPAVDSDLTFSGSRLTTTDLTVTNFPTISSLTTGSVMFGGASSVVAQDNTNFFWDDTNKRLGLGTATPEGRLNLVSVQNPFSGLNSATNYQLAIRNTSTTTDQGAGIGFHVSSSSGVSGAIVYQRKGSLSYGDLVFFVTPSGGSSTEKVRIESTGNLKLTDSLQVASGAVVAALDHGTYTPTLTNVANLDASTAYSCQWMRVGNTVTVSGKVDVDPTLAATSTQLGISLPVASDLANNNECAGTAFASGIAGMGAAILGDATNNRAEMQWVSGDISNQPMYFSFTYRII